MDKKGFTLIELLAVVTLIALISIIAIPKITNSILKKKDELSEVNQKLLASAADTYLENNQSLYNNSYESNGSTYCIPVQALIDNGILEKPFKNINGKEIDYTDKVKATYQAEYNGFSYELVNKNSCTELIQYVSRPQLAENMIPVIYDSDKNSWVKADENSHWYNYSEKKWANAVLVNEYKSTEQNSKSRYEYEQSQPGTPILESDILAYFTWIPRFRYQLFDSNTQTPINIVFEDVGTIKSEGKSAGQWLTHPAFTYNNNELSGIWVGKYETSNQNDNPIIKNQTAWTNIDYATANKKAIAMTNENNIYGLKNVNTHMTRNSEWSAAAYLTNSIYGNLSNNSSTGNITGIYNLSGNKEFVILDNKDENSLGYALNETKNWITNNSYITDQNIYLTRGNSSIFSYNNSKVIDTSTTFRISLSNTESQTHDYKRKYIVTFDPQGGTVDTKTKEVSYHETYGTLPTPTRSGYTFLGWNGKNIAHEINNQNYSSYSYYNRTTCEIKNENNENYIRINGNSSTTNIDTSWIVYSSNKIKLYPKNYTLSFNVRSKNANTQYIKKKDGTSDGKTGIYNYSTDINNMTMISNIENDYNFNNNGEWYYFASKMTISENTENAIITIGNDYPNIYGTNSYIDIKNIQLEEGDTATEYEPYYITPSTTVTQEGNHTLKAIWKANS